MVWGLSDWSRVSLICAMRNSKRLGKEMFNTEDVSSVKKISLGLVRPIFLLHWGKFCSTKNRKGLMLFTDNRGTVTS